MKKGFAPGKNLYAETLNIIRAAIKDGEVKREERSPRLIFLCGANKPEHLGGGLSERRSAVRSFIEKKISPSFVIVAEHFFETLTKHFKSQSNLLDEEYFLSEIADDVIIILESESAFCELGAFSHNDLREKVIVINNKKFYKSKSFINLGPIDAIDKSTKRNPIILYDMEDTGIQLLDGIGDTFSELQKAINHNHKSIKPVTSELLQPSRRFEANKSALMFAADFIYFNSPVTFKDLISSYKVIFPNWDSYDGLKKLISLLNGLNLINYNCSGEPIETNMNKTFYGYGKHEDDLILNFKLCVTRRRAQNVTY